MLRNLLLALALAGFAIALCATAFDLAAWPTFLFPALVVVGIVFERVHYRGNATDAAPDGWRRTGERFIDDASGRPVTVWFNATTGERRYVDE